MSNQTIKISFPDETDSGTALYCEIFFDPEREFVVLRNGENLRPHVDAPIKAIKLINSIIQSDDVKQLEHVHGVIEISDFGFKFGFEGSDTRVRVNYHQLTALCALIEGFKVPWRLRGMTWREWTAEQGL